MKALGLIETYGFIGAIEAADVMLKVANISLLKLEKVRGGLVTITVEGDVGAVKQLWKLEQVLFSTWE